MANQERQEGGSTEAPLAIVGSIGLGRNQQDEPSFFTPEDAEFQRYSELIQGFFEKFARWKEISMADEYQIKLEEDKDYNFIRGQAFDVLSSLHGPYIKPISNNPPDRLLSMEIKSEKPDPQHGSFLEEFIVKPGQAGRQLLVDPEDHTPLEHVYITISAPFQAYYPTTLNRYFRALGISTKREGTVPGLENNHRHGGYTLWVGTNTLEVSHGAFYSIEMTDEMTTYFINTIDALIPQVNPQLPEQPAGEQ